LSLLLLLSSANVDVVEDGIGVMGAVALATPAPPNKSAAVVKVTPSVLRIV
jgi:hypothetical protein